MYDFLSGSRWCGIYRSGISGISICSGGAAGYQLDSGESSGFLEEQKEMQEEVKAKEKAYKEEKERRLGFHGKYPEGFYRVMWKNFKRSKKDFIVYAGMNLLPASLIFAGVGMAQMLAPFNKEGNILTGHGITAILLEFLIVTLIASLMLMIANLLSYFRKRMRNYSIFTRWVCVSQHCILYWARDRSGEL